MDGTYFRLNVDDRVRIRDEVDPSLYQGLSTLYNEGVITQVRKDRYDLPQVYVKWDKNHWSYNGAPDCWTYEDHFDLIETMTEPSKQDLARQLAADFANGMAGLFADGETEAAPEPSKAAQLRTELSTDTLTVAEAEHEDETLAVLAAVSAQLAEAEAFIVIAVGREEHPKSAKGILIPYAMSYAHNPAAELLATAHMAGLATRAHQELTIQAIAALTSDDES